MPLKQGILLLNYKHEMSACNNPAGLCRVWHILIKDTITILITIHRRLIIHISTTRTTIHIIRRGLIIILTVITVIGLSADITDMDSASISFSH
jgi:hypothetical protein